jgi:hypothetical protein
VRPPSGYSSAACGISTTARSLTWFLRYAIHEGMQMKFRIHASGVLLLGVCVASVVPFATAVAGETRSDRAATAPGGVVSETADAKSDAKSAAVRFDPIVRQIEGWSVHVEPVLLDGAHRDEGAAALAMLANHLQRVKILVPAEPLARLQQIEIWVEHNHPRLRAKQYHPSRDWLIANGHDPRLARKVHVTQASQLLSREQLLKHPAVILHELAHGYHDQFLSFDHREIIEAYERAKTAGTYENVLLYTGSRVKHYGLTNHKEYFAEGTEAYFYRNDFYPFVRAELKEHDPTLHDLLERIWGPAR